MKLLKFSIGTLLIIQVNTIRELTLFLLFSFDSIMYVFVCVCVAVIGGGEVVVHYALKCAHMHFKEIKCFGSCEFQGQQNSQLH